jgi:hypothetical protein
MGAPSEGGGDSQFPPFASSGPHRALRTRVTLSMTAGLMVVVIPLLVWVGSMARTRMLVSSPWNLGAVTSRAMKLQLARR